MSPVTLRTLGAKLPAEEAEVIFAQGKEAVVFALLELAKQLAEQAGWRAKPSPTTPSGMVPPYQKPVISGRRKRPGRKAGHSGQRRQAPEQIDQHLEHRCKQCPTCQGPLKRCQET